MAGEILRFEDLNALVGRKVSGVVTEDVYDEPEVQQDIGFATVNLGVRHEIGERVFGILSIRNPEQWRELYDKNGRVVDMAMDDDGFGPAYGICTPDPDFQEVHMVITPQSFPQQEVRLEE